MAAEVGKFRDVDGQCLVPRLGASDAWMEPIEESDFALTQRSLRGGLWVGAVGEVNRSVFAGGCLV